MKNYILLDAISGIDSDIIAEHIKFKERTAARSSRLLRVLPIAAALVILTALALAVLPALLPDDPVPPIITDTPTDAPIVTETPETSVLENPDIVWNRELLNDAANTRYKSFSISNGLKEAFRNNTENKTFAVTLYIDADMNFVYNGKTIREYFEEIQTYDDLAGKIKKIIRIHEDWEDEIKNHNAASSFIQYYGEDIYNTCFSDGVFQDEAADKLLTETQANAELARDKYVKAQQALYDTIPVSLFTDYFDSMGIEYIFIDSSYKDSVYPNISYLPGKEFVFFINNDSYAELDFSFAGEFASDVVGLYSARKPKDPPIDDGTVMVCIWLRDDTLNLDGIEQEVMRSLGFTSEKDFKTNTDFDAYTSLSRQKKSEAIMKQSEMFVAEHLSDATEIFVSKYAPMIICRIKKDDWERLSALDLVGEIFLADE